MGFIEEDTSLRAPEYERAIRYTYDSELDGTDGWRYVYDNGAINCAKISQYANMCRMSPVEMNTIGQTRLPFVYMDVGRWGGKEHSFGIVSGQDVYLCEYVPGEGFDETTLPQCKNESVNTFIQEMWGLNCATRVINYARAPNVTQATVTDTHIYLLIPDFHMPPISWFYPPTTVAAADPSIYLDPPPWIMQTPSYLRHTNLYRGMYGLKKAAEAGNGLPTHPADIFSPAGPHMARFLKAMAGLSKKTISRLHLINMGDMFELWLGRDYQYTTDGLQPSFKAGGQDNASDWSVEVMLFNTDVIEAIRGLSSAGFAEIKHLWGNHDAYLSDPAVTGQVGIQQRDPSYRGLNGDLFVEHGQRFDSSNHDAIKSSAGPFWANAAYYFPKIRKAEPIGRGAVTLLSGAPEERDAYFLGASLLYLNEKFDQSKKPFSIFCMGHTHQRHMRMFNITKQYSLYGAVQ